MIDRSFARGLSILSLMGAAACGGGDSGSDTPAADGGAGGASAGSSGAGAKAGTSSKGGSAGSTGGKGGSAGNGGMASAGKGGSAGNGGTATAGKGGTGGTASAGKGGTGGTASAGKGGAAGTSSTGGSGTAGSGTAGSGTAGSGTAGSGTAGSGTAGSGTAGSGTAGSGTAGSGTAGSGTGGTGAGGNPIMPGDPGAHDVLFAIDTAKDVHPISRYIYGTNQGDFTKEAKGLTMARVGGNRMTAYNWETNASNAGSDYLFENDAFISASKVAGEPMKQAVTAATSADASIIMTVPIAGWVSADESGPCPSNPSPAQIAQHFFPVLAKKGSAFAYPPDLNDKKVYADEFVGWLESQFPTAQTDPNKRIFYMLDNEPDLWSSTHSEIHPSPVTYAELAQKNAEFGKAIKDAAPGAIVFGPVNYGYAGFLNLQNAPDAGGKNFIDSYLDSMKAAEASAGKRVVDVLDVHWYPEATGDGKRIVDDGTSPGEFAARLQAPRSLWDSSYIETSWITGCCSNGAINLIPWLKGKIDAHYPGTKLSISEYNYGAGPSISGGLAEADVLGVFGREDIFAASLWEMSSVNSSFIFGGFALYRNYDGSGGTFGDTSVSASTSDVVMATAYGSTTAGGGVVVVVVNKDAGEKVAGITVSAPTAFTGADVYTLTSASASPQKGASLTAVATNAFSFKMPGYSASTIVFK